MWDEEAEETEQAEEASSQPLLAWAALLMGGVAVGVGSYLMLLPGGALHPALEALTAPPTTAPTEVASPTLEPTPCLTPPVSPPETFSAFIAAIDRGDYQSAWSRLDPTLQQNLYGGEIEALAAEWSRFGSIELGQMTFVQPREGEATLLAGLTLERPQRAQFDYQLQLNYRPSSCAWLIHEISLQAEEDINVSPSPTQAPAIE